MNRPRPAMDRSRAVSRLDAEKSLTLDRLAALRADFAAIVVDSTDSNADDEHDPEGATIAFERSQLEALIHQANRHLDEIELARARLAKGTYESCEICGKPIARARLEARPIARTCITCATTPGRT